jgi:hypothetical protein
MTGGKDIAVQSLSQRTAGKTLIYLGMFKVLHQGHSGAGDG